MERHRRTGEKWLSGTALLCLALAACNKAPQATQPVNGAPIAALQLATAPPPPPSYAPPATALPPAPRPVAYRPSREHWRYLTDAYDMSDAFGDTPPDYTVDYDGEYPYVWRADDGAYRVVEWLPDGARYYYYEPGADEPFLIQDPEYSYAYDNGALVAVYTLAGALAADRIADERRAYAERYYARAHNLYRAAVNDRRRAAYADDWRGRAPVIQTQRVRWQQGRQEDRDWREWSRAHEAQQQARWAPERQHRAAYAAALGAAGVAGAAYAAHQRDREAAEHAQARPQSPRQPQPPLNALGRPVPFPGHGRPDLAERHAEADRAQPGLLHAPQPTPRAHGQHPAPTAPQAPAPQPGHAEPMARQALAQAQQAQRHEQQQAAQDQRRAMQQARQAEHREIQQAEQQHGREAAQAARRQHQEMMQAAQAQRRDLQQAQQAQRHEAVRAAQVQRDTAQRAQQAQHAAMQAERAQVRADAHPAPPRPEAPRMQPQLVRAAAPHPQPPHPAPHREGNGRSDDQHHH